MSTTIQTHPESRPARHADYAVRVLFVAARPGAAQSVRRRLLDTGEMDCRICADPDDALTMIRSWRPSVVLLDLPFAGRAAQTLIRTLRGDAELASTTLMIFGDISPSRARLVSESLGADGCATGGLDTLPGSIRDAILVRRRFLIRNDIGSTVSKRAPRGGMVVSFS